MTIFIVAMGKNFINFIPKGKLASALKGIIGSIKNEEHKEDGLFEKFQGGFITKVYEKLIKKTSNSCM